MSQSDIELHAISQDTPKIGLHKARRIAPRKRVMLQLLFFVVGCVLLISLQGGFSFLLAQIEEKIISQRSLVELTEQLHKQLLAVEKNTYLLSYSQSALEQLERRSEIYQAVSQLKTQLSILRWGGNYMLPSTAEMHVEDENIWLSYTPVFSHQNSINKLLELVSAINQIDRQVAQVSLLLIRQLKVGPIDNISQGEQLRVQLAALSASFKQVDGQVEHVLRKIKQQLAELERVKHQQRVISLGLHALLALLVIVIIVSMGLKIIRQIEEEDARLQELIDELENARESEREVGKAKANFLSTISHEILTPINAVIGLISLLLNSKLNREQYRYAKSIKDSSDQLLGIVNDIQDFYKLDSGQFDFDHIDFDLQTLIESIYEIISARALKKKLKVGYFMDPEVKSVYRGDPAKIRQVLINLLSNAIKFTANGGIVLEVRRINHADLEITRFEVRDSGIGISEQALPELFDSFTQVDNRLSRQYGGIGLGLAISKHIVELMQGKIGVKSCSNEGSIFWFELPLERAGKRNFSTNYTEEEKFNLQEVLYIDELDINRDLTLKKLHHWNLQATAKNGTVDGFKELWKNKVNGKCNYVVLIDLATESDEQSIDFVHQVKAEASFKLIPIIFTTTMSLKKIEISLPNYREERITPLIKPYRNDQLRMALLNAFNQLGSEDGEYPIVDEYLQQLKHRQSEQVNKQLKVLVVDDNSVNQMVAKGYLSKKGHHIVFADNGKQALDMVKKEQFDLILMDLQMPIMDGISATRAIRKLPQANKNSIPIVAMTANAMAAERKNCYAAGMNDFLSKPIDKTMLDVVLAGNFETPLR